MDKDTIIKDDKLAKINIGISSLLNCQIIIKIYNIGKEGSILMQMQFFPPI